MSSEGRTGSTQCASRGCCEPRANEVVELCDRHQREVNEFAAWLDGLGRIVVGGGVLVTKANDDRCAFDVARSAWAAGGVSRYL